ncbi:MAG: homocysteine S-methyltransferase family protein [Nocardioides sp.]
MRLTDGGLETSLIFHQGLDLPLFAAFPLVERDDGKAALESYWQPYLELADERGATFVVDTATWRASPDWGTRLGYDADGLRAANEAAVRLARHLAGHTATATVNGTVGPRGDGYVVGVEMTADLAQDYHRVQLEALVGAGVDTVTALTLTYPAEAVGFVRAAAALGTPAMVSFTVETDGRLPNGEALADAVTQVDRETDGAAAGFMVNCAHPTHLEDALVDGDWLGRVTGLRANASTMSHAELDAAEELDDGDPDDLSRHYTRLLGRLPALDVVGGCCGTDHRHVRAIADALL